MPYSADWSINKYSNSSFNDVCCLWKGVRITLEHVQLLMVHCRNLSSFLQFDPDYHITQVRIRHKTTGTITVGRGRGEEPGESGGVTSHTLLLPISISSLSG